MRVRSIPRARRSIFTRITWSFEKSKGCYLRRLGRWDDAIAVFRQLVDREPSNSLYVIHLVESLRTTRRFPEVLDAVHASERDGSPDSYIAWIAANAEEAIGRDPEALRRYLDGWSDRLDPGVSWTIEQIYLTDSGQTKKLASHLVSTRDDQFNMSFAGLLMPAACRGYGRMLQGVPNAPRHGREMSETAARISRLPSREWNVALLEEGRAVLR
jgi:hypothetical protein